MFEYWFLIGIILIVIIGLFFYLWGRKPRRITELKKKYYKLSNMPPHIAEDTLNRQIESLKKKHPDRPLEWYLEKVIFDLERDRR